MGQHALDGEMGFARIGGPEDRRHACASGSGCSGRLRGKSNGHYASRPASEPTISSAAGSACITMRRSTRAWLSIRTTLERIAPESLTQGLYGFVHGDIWQVFHLQLQDGVARICFKRVFVLSNVNSAADTLAAEESRTIGCHCVFVPLTDARFGTGTEVNSDAWSTACPIGVGPCARNGTKTRVPATGASHTSISRCLVRYLIDARDGI